MQPSALVNSCPCHPSCLTCYIILPLLCRARTWRRAASSCGCCCEFPAGPEMRRQTQGGQRIAGQSESNHCSADLSLSLTYEAEHDTHEQDRIKYCFPRLKNNIFISSRFVTEDTILLNLRQWRMEVNIPKSEIKVMPKPWRINANTILSYSGLTRELTVSHICQDLIVISGNSSSLLSTLHSCMWSFLLVSVEVNEKYQIRMFTQLFFLNSGNYLHKDRTIKVDSKNFLNTSQSMNEVYLNIIGQGPKIFYQFLLVTLSRKVQSWLMKSAN